jgi:hypothetical protein
MVPEQQQRQKAVIELNSATELHVIALSYHAEAAVRQEQLVADLRPHQRQVDGRADLISADFAQGGLFHAVGPDGRVNSPR